MKKLFAEFKQFISRGSVVDLAAGVIIGAAFTAIVNAFVASIITPLIAVAMSSLTGSDDFAGMQFSVGEVTFSYGALVSAIVSFFLTAMVVFLLVKAFNRIGGTKKETAPAPVWLCPLCRSEVKPEAVKCPFCTSDITPVGQ